MDNKADYYAHPTAIIESDSIGSGTKIWAFSHVSSGATIGENCTIGEGVHIGPNVKIGNNVKIQNHALLYEGVEIEDHVFIGPIFSQEPLQGGRLIRAPHSEKH